MTTKGLQPGKILTITAGGAVTSGSVQEVGSALIGVAIDGASGSGVQYPLATEGVFTIVKKTGETWAVGDKLYWDANNTRASKTEVSGAADNFIGLATAVAGSSATTGNCKLRGGANFEDADSIAKSTFTAANQFISSSASATPAVKTAAETRSILGVSLANKAGTAAPGVSDDSAAGYEVGSVWVNATLDQAYVCLDASAGAAVWREIGPAKVQVDVASGSSTGTVGSLSAYNGSQTVATISITTSNAVAIASAAVSGGTLTVTLTGDPGASGAKCTVLLWKTAIV